jgi:superoxide reductase
MAKENGIYKCDICGNVVHVFEAGAGDLVCCGVNMTYIKPKDITEEGKEKHVPVIETEGNVVTVKVGSVLHPMQDDHYISLILLFDEDKFIGSEKVFPGDEPIVKFVYEGSKDNLKARSYCNVHGVFTN